MICDCECSQILFSLPEQATNWDWFSDKIKNAGRPVKVLNLFAYTGGATLAAAAAGASVTHVDASKGMVMWAKENAASSGLSEAPIRWLVDDCVKFVEREIRRGNHYDGIIMDPPSYGRGPKGEIWKIEESIFPFVELCEKLLSDDPLFFLINSYTTGLAPAVLTYMIGTAICKKHGGHVESDEIGLPVTLKGLGIDEVKPEQIMEVARLACAPDDTMGNMPFDVQPEDLYAAIMGADALGRYYTEE